MSQMALDTYLSHRGIRSYRLYGGLSLAFRDEFFPESGWPKAPFRQPRRPIVPQFEDDGLAGRYPTADPVLIERIRYVRHLIARECADPVDVDGWRASQRKYSNRSHPRCVAISQLFAEEDRLMQRVVPPRRFFALNGGRGAPRRPSTEPRAASALYFRNRVDPWIPGRICYGRAP